MRRFLAGGATGRLLITAGVALLAAGMAAIGASAAAASAASPASAVRGLGHGSAKPAPEWPSGGQGLADDRFQPDETAIDVKTAARLAPRWTLAVAGDVSATPAVVNGVVYVPDWGGYLSAIRANDGNVIWRRLISSYNGIAGSISRTDPVIDGSTLVIGTQTGADIIAVNTATGARKWITRADGQQYAQITGAAVVDRGVVYVGVSSSQEAAANNPAYKCCTFRGSLIALSESTGKVLWKTYTVPANSGKQGGYSGGAVWGSTPAIDQATNSVYVGTGNNYTIPAAAAACVANAMKHHTSDAKCTAPNDYFDSVLSLNLKTGKVNWGRKVEGYDAWTAACLNVPKGTTWCPSPAGQDYDFGAGANLFTTKSTAGRVETLLGIGQKSGVYWAFNPVNGRLAWDTLVGPGSVDGGTLWGTATDGTRIYVAEGNRGHTPFTLRGSGPEAGTTCHGGAWSAISPATGHILWSFASAGSVASGPAIVGGSVYWGSGYTKSGDGSPSIRLYAFSVAAAGSARARSRVQQAIFSTPATHTG